MEEEAAAADPLEEYYRALQTQAASLYAYIAENVHLTDDDKAKLVYLQTADGALMYGFVRKFVLPRTLAYVNERNAMADPTLYGHCVEALTALLPPEIVKRVRGCRKAVQSVLMDYLCWFVMAVSTDEDTVESTMDVV